MKSNRLKAMFSVFQKLSTLIWPIFTVGFCVFLIFKELYPQAIANMFFFIIFEIMAIRMAIDEMAETSHCCHFHVVESEEPVVP